MIEDTNDEFEKYSYILDDDMTFPKATIDPKLIKLQKDVTEFITSVILKHEREFYQLVENNFNSEYENVLGYTRDYIIEMIVRITNKFYNKLYYDIQHNVESDLVKLLLSLCEFTDYGPHILLDKLIRLTLDAHLEISREDLVFNDNKYDIYEKSVLMQLNTYLLSCNLLHILSKGEDEEGPFINIPEGANAFNIVIDKNIKF